MRVTGRQASWINGDERGRRRGRKMDERGREGEWKKEELEGKKEVEKKRSE